MSENENQQVDTQTEDVSGLRKQYEETRAELKALKAERRQRAYQDAGLPEGAYDIFDKTYDGELTTEALRSYAESKGFRVGGDSPQSADATPPQAESQNRLDAVDANRLPTDRPSLEQQIQEAMAEGNFEKSRALKHELLNEKNRARRASAL